MRRVPPTLPDDAKARLQQLQLSRMASEDAARSANTRLQSLPNDTDPAMLEALANERNKHNHRFGQLSQLLSKVQQWLMELPQSVTLESAPPVDVTLSSCPDEKAPSKATGTRTNPGCDLGSRGGRFCVNRSLCPTVAAMDHSRRSADQEQAQIDLPFGFEDLADASDIAHALAELKRKTPALRKVVVKLNEGFSGEGNAVFDLSHAPANSSLPSWIRDRLRNLSFEARGMTWDLYE
jgi:hypothetical protein